MKKLYILFLFTSLIVPQNIFSMDSKEVPFKDSGLASATSGGASGFTPCKQAITIKVQESNGKSVEFKVPENIISQSKTIKHMLEDCDYQEGMKIPMENISADNFKVLIPYLKRIFTIKTMLDDEQQQEQKSLINDLKKHSLEELVTITNDVSFLDVPLLLDCCIDLLTQKVFREKNVQHVFELLSLDLLRLVVKKCLVQYGIEDREVKVYRFNQLTSVCTVETKDGCEIISGYADGTIDIGTRGFRLTESITHTGAVTSICAMETKDGLRIISGSKDNTICIWDMRGELLAQCIGHIGGVQSVCAVETNEDWRIISKSQDGIRIWDLDGNQVAQCTPRVDKSLDEVHAIETKNGWRIISSEWRGLRRPIVYTWDLGGRQLARFKAKCELHSVYPIETKKGLRIVLGVGDYQSPWVLIYNMDGRLLAKCSGHTHYVMSVCAIETQDGLRIISGSWDGTMRIWDMNGRQLTKCIVSDKTFFSSCVSMLVCPVKTKDGWRIISGATLRSINSENSSVVIINIWDLHGNKFSQSNRFIYADGYDSSVSTIAGRHIIFQCKDIIVTWDTLSLLDKLNTLTRSQAIAIHKIISSNALTSAVNFIIDPRYKHDYRSRIAYIINHPEKDEKDFERYGSSSTRSCSIQ